MTHTLTLQLNGRPLLRAFAAFVLVWLLATPAAQAQDVESRASTAVANILFDADADEFTTYKVNARGFVDISFASNTPDALYSELLARLQNHPDIPGVLAGKGGPACRRF